MNLLIGWALIMIVVFLWSISWELNSIKNVLKNNKKIPTRFFKKSINNEKIKLEYEGYKKNASEIFEKQEDLIDEKNNIINDKELEIKILKNKLSKLMKN